MRFTLDAPTTARCRPRLLLLALGVVGAWVGVVSARAETARSFADMDSLVRAQHTASAQPTEPRPLRPATSPLDASSAPAAAADAPRTPQSTPLDGTWEPLVPLGLPGGRDGHVCVFDSNRQRMLIFGGYSDTSSWSDTWALDLAGDDPAWTQIPTTGTPPPFSTYAAAIYDPLRDRLVVFAGGNFTNDTFALSLATSPAVWTTLQPGGPLPPRRSYAMAAYDPVRDRMLVMGGGYFAAYGDLWALDLQGDGTWSEIVPTGERPSPRGAGVLIYDPVRDRLVEFGGYGSTFLGDTWELTLSGSPTWHLLQPNGAGPSARWLVAGGFDSGAYQLIIMGGWPENGPYTRDTWALDLLPAGTWTELLATPTPPAVIGHSVLVDSMHDQLVHFGGIGAYESDQTWALPLASPALTWAQWFAGLATGLPIALRDACGVYDSQRDRLEEFGGNFCNSTTSTCSTQGMSWFQFSDPAAWLYTTDGGAHPSPRHGAAAVYHPSRDEFLLFGGQTQYTCDGTCFTYWNDAHTLQLWNGAGIWQPLATTGTPPAGRAFHSLVHDGVRDRLVVYGGTGPGVDGTVWTLDLTQSPAVWAPLATTGAPPARWGHGAIYDLVRDQMVVYGGKVQPLGTPGSEVWTLAFATTPAQWRLALPLGTAPPARSGMATVYDTERDRLVVFGGQGVAGLLNDTWALPLQGSPAWWPLQPTGTAPVARTGLVAVYDPGRSRLVIEGGSTGSANIRDTWTLTWDRAVAVRVGPAVVQASATAVTLAWRVARGVRAGVERRDSGAEAWRTLTPTPLAERDGTVRLEDTTVLAGQRYTYALRLANSPQAREGETSVTVPAQWRLAVSAMGGAAGASRLWLTASQAGAVEIELYDAHGRCVNRQTRVVRVAGPQALAYSALRAAAGIYVVRVTQAGAGASGRVVILH